MLTVIDSNSLSLGSVISSIIGLFNYKKQINILVNSETKYNNL